MCCESWERMKDVNVEGEEGREREPGGVNGWSEVKKESEMAWTPTKQNDTTNVTRRVGEWARVEEWVSECCWRRGVLHPKLKLGRLTTQIVWNLCA